MNPRLPARRFMECPSVRFSPGAASHNGAHVASRAAIGENRANSVARGFLLYSLLIMFSSLISGCGSINYVQNRTVELPSREPIPPTTVAAGKWIGDTKGTSLHNLNKPFHFTDPRPRVLVLGHVEVLRDGGPVEDVGAFVFYGDEFESNFGFFDFIGGGGEEAVTFVSGNWFAGYIYAGHRRLHSVKFAADKDDRFRSNRFAGCGSNINIFRFPKWEPFFDLKDPTKAYYLGHITFNVVPIEFWRGARLKATVRDMSDQYADELRVFLGDLEVARTMFPNCPE